MLKLTAGQLTLARRIGAVKQSDGSAVPGFICEGQGIGDATDISPVGG